jgi:hypothetical protein
MCRYRCPSEGRRGAGQLTTHQSSDRHCAIKHTSPCVTNPCVTNPDVTKLPRPATIHRDSLPLFALPDPLKT